MNTIQLGAVSLAASSMVLAVFPLVRPFGERSTIPPAPEGAQILTSTGWVIAHMLGAVGFILLPLGLFGLYSFLKESPDERSALQGLMLSWLGVGLFLPIFGSEAFALRAIGNATINQKIASADLPGLVNSIRFGPQVGFLVLSLVLLAVGGILIGVAVWRSNILPRWSGILLAVGLALFFPLFPQPIRVIDGLLTGVGGVWIALSMLLHKGGTKRISTQLTHFTNVDLIRNPFRNAYRTIPVLAVELFYLPSCLLRWGSISPFGNVEPESRDDRDD